MSTKRKAYLNNKNPFLEKQLREYESSFPEIDLFLAFNPQNLISIHKDYPQLRGFINECMISHPESLDHPMIMLMWEYLEISESMRTSFEQGELPDFTNAILNSNKKWQLEIANNIYRRNNMELSVGVNTLENFDAVTHMDLRSMALGLPTVSASELVGKNIR